jgi:hypothetical protein
MRAMFSVVRPTTDIPANGSFAPKGAVRVGSFYRILPIVTVSTIPVSVGQPINQFHLTTEASANQHECDIADSELRRGRRAVGLAFQRAPVKAQRAGKTHTKVRCTETGAFRL